MKSIKNRVKNGETLKGCWLNLGSPVASEIVGLAGFDWVLIDIEHGAGGENEVLHQLQALEHTKAVPIVRVESSQRQRIHRVLDMGAGGIMCPRINTVEEAKSVVEGVLYPPEGKRGVAKMVRATGFGKNFSDYSKNAKESILSVVQIESVDVLNHVDEIAALNGVDVLFIGPSDLTMDLGVFGNYEHPLYKEALKETINATQKAGKASGILLADPDDFQKYNRMGFTLIACGADASFVASGAREMFQRLNNQHSIKNK